MTASPSLRIHWLVLATALILASGARPASGNPLREADPPGSPLLAPARELTAGALVELSWKAPPDGIEELEILLSIDDGAHYAIRVSPELDARERRYLWRVPDLPTSHARLRMRMGNARTEIETGPTASFRILGAPGGRGSEPLVREGISWRALESPGDAGSGTLTSATRLERGGEASAPAESPTRDSLGPPRTCGTPATPADPRLAATAPSARAGGNPRNFPRRN